ncbi:MAG: hypothetical protein ABI599_07850 [Flavobacteriales bacterium]
MPTATRSRVDATTIQQVSDLLRAMLASNEVFVITNRSLDVIISHYANHLSKGAGLGKLDETFERLNEQVPKFREQLLVEAKKDMVTFKDGRKVPVLSESKSSAAIEWCQRNKPEFP